MRARGVWQTCSRAILFAALLIARNQPLFGNKSSSSHIVCYVWGKGGIIIISLSLSLALSSL